MYADMKVGVNFPFIENFLQIISNCSPPKFNLCVALSSFSSTSNLYI